MRKNFLVTMLLVGLILLAFTSVTLASHGEEPAGACPSGFELHHAGMHDHEGHDEGMAHRHVGLDSDLNGDGYWCVKHVGGAQHVHVHVDNDLPLP